MKMLISTILSLGLFALGMASASAAGFDGTSVVTATEADLATDTIVVNVQTLVATVIALAVFLLTKMFGMKILRFVISVFSR